MTDPTPLSPAAQVVLNSMYEVNMDFNDENRALAAAALRAAAAQMVNTHDLTDAVEDVIRGAERQHQAG